MTAMNAVALLCLFAAQACAFAGPSADRTASSSSVLFSADRAAAESTSSDEKATLTFMCNSVFQSGPISGDATPKQVFEFLQQPAQRDCLVSAGNQNKVTVVETTSELLDEWKLKCQTVAATGVPETADSVLQVVTGGIAFPGLTVSSNAYIGSKLLLGGPASDDAFPVYEFVLIKDEQSVKGFKPAVWLFEKLTGANNNDGKKDPPISLSRVTAVRQDGGIVFQTTSNLTIKVNFPKLLLKLLPATKEQAEEQGSAAIVKKLEVDLQEAMRVLEEQYLAQS